jgi:hypothetical protein
MRPEMVLPHGAFSANAEAPRQRRAQRAEGKRLRGAASVVASTAAAPERVAFHTRPEGALCCSTYAFRYASLAT